MILPLYRAVWLTLLWAVGAPAAHAQVAALWSTDDGHKLLAREDRGAVGQPIALFGMRNETLAFQLVVEAGPEGISDLRIELAPLAGVEARIYREDSVVVKERSHDLVWKPGSAAEPKDRLGATPDRLVPQRGPLTIAAGQRQAFWIDLWIPPEAQAGVYSGLVQVKAAGACENCALSIELEILDRVMPDRVRARSMLWFSGGETDDGYVNNRYFADPSSASAEAKAKLREQHHQLAHRHRLSLFWGHHEAPNQELERLLSGESFTGARGYSGPGEGLGLDLLVTEAYGGELTRAQAEQWLRFAEGYSDLLHRFVYVFDEPSESDYQELNRRARVSRPMPAFVTTSYTPALEVDIFAAPAGHYDRANARRAAEAGKELWIYNGERPATGTFAIDDVGISPRVNPWIQYKLGIERWFYWEATYYKDFQGKRGPVDVIADPINFSNRHGDRVNGDGLLIYPGRDFLFPHADAGIDAPLPSIRLKNWRRGIEDVEYLVMAREAGFDAEVDALLDRMLPRVVDGARGAVSWPEDGASWLAARRYLFELLRDGSSQVLVAELGRAPGQAPGPARSRLILMMGLGGLCALLVLLALRWRHSRG